MIGKRKGKRCHRPTDAIMRWAVGNMLSKRHKRSCESTLTVILNRELPYFHTHWSFFVLDGYYTGLYLVEKMT